MLKGLQIYDHFMNCIKPVGSHWIKPSRQVHIAFLQQLPYKLQPHYSVTVGLIIGVLGLTS